MEDSEVDLNHSHGYHGSSKDCCIWCGSGASENEECPRRRAEWEKMKKEEGKFEQDVRKLYKSLGRKNRSILRELCDRAGTDLGK